ncbi:MULTISPECIES: cytochrome b/b6 domain-containing protein [Paraburkholderia]|uniref:Cytochrome b/b6 domain-containing protein n=1 Tax=Paraburkholderia madseniana TaxID=2599607 RepID=A0AAP5EMW0_9BURK|nr:MULTISPECIES: cytochrome b/b6 domain-containing protein [Paraburkholderia]MCX4145053.1 cytochrome b/b6 domain-containing protein [Paraburkholderia madseniana]MDN7148004.1 cytochrome b/b6 domain-containing protein [Paraburkholderia sp. WS6]MDQ6406884.1 cytochrome b/b6 domain-containing protein [Paraburkholderia madseniana]
MNADEPVTPAVQPVGRRVLVWDVPTRLFHWLMVVLVAAAYATLKLNWIGWHVRSGEALLALLLFRVLWGCFGSETARFRSFVASPASALRHLSRLFRREPDVQVGHNAAGGWMVLVLLTLLLLETLSGLYVYNEVADEGSLSERVPAWIANAISTLHAVVWDALLAAVALHVLVIAIYAVVKGHNLLRPMLNGYKALPASVAAPRQAPAWLALLPLGIGAAVVVLLAAYL